MVVCVFCWSGVWYYMVCVLNGYWVGFGWIEVVFGDCVCDYFVFDCVFVGQCVECGDGDLVMVDFEEVMQFFVGI